MNSDNKRRTSEKLGESTTLLVEVVTNHVTKGVTSINSPPAVMSTQCYCILIKI